MMKYIKKYYNKFKKYVIHNKQFCSYVILSVLCGTTLRLFTSHNMSIFPLIFDLSLSIIIGSFTYFFKPKKQFKYLFTCLIILSVFCIINAIYYAFYSSFASFSLIASLSQVGEVEDAVFDKIKIFQFIYIIYPLLFYIINRKLTSRDYFNYITKIENNKKILKNVLITGFVTLALGFIFINKGSFSSLTKQWNREYTVNHFGITLYQINDFFNTLRPTISSWIGYDQAYKKFTDYYADNTIHKSNNEYTNKFKNYNVIFVHMESIMDFLIDLKINNQEITPNLNNLIKEGMFFSNFYPQISVGTSSDTEFTLNTSLMPAISGTVFVSYYDREYPSIPKLLKKQGYYTFSMHANKASMWNRNKMHPSLGYMDFYSSTSFDIDEEIGLGLSDKSFFKQAIPILEKIEDNNQKYMGTIITLTNHTPFTNNEAFDQIDLTYTKDEETLDYLDNTKLGDYIRSSHYADDALGDFINYIKKSNHFDNTIFIFYGDHNPQLDLKEYYNYYNYDFNTGEILHEQDENFINYDYYENELNKKTPLIIWTKNNRLNTQIDSYMGMIDVMPTIGNMIGIYNKYALGHDIFEIKDDNIIAFPNGNYLTNKVYYRSSKEEYKTLNSNEILSEDYIKNCKEYTDTMIEISNGIIVHDLIKTSENKDEALERK